MDSKTTKPIMNLRSVKRQAISMTQESLVSTGFLEGQTLPLVIQPKVEGLSLPVWAKHNLELIKSSLINCGGILFRGFGVSTQSELEAFVQSISLPQMYYMEGATPRTELSAKVYTSTEYPADQSIALHNELNYVKTWPMKIMFCCAVAAEQGGETPIADVRKVYKRIDRRIIEQFERKGWMLMRNFGDGMSLPWQTAFRMNTKEELEQYCNESAIKYEWKQGDRLRTRQVRPAIRNHPQTGEPVWFNHVAFWHVSSLAEKVREVFLTQFEQEDLPYNTYYGDGSDIEEDAVEEIREAYRQETVANLWEKGDMLMMDNMLVAHGRSPYKGARKILVTMGEPFSDLSL